MRLHLGSAGDRKPGHFGIDMIEDPDTVDMVWDLNKVPWPWERDSIESIFADNVLEHLCPLGKSQAQLNIPAVMSEIHRVLQPGGTVEIIVPSTDGRGAWQDPTHVTYWNRNTFLYYIKGEMNFMAHNLAGYPQFITNRRDLGVTDVDRPESGIVFTVARLMKPLEEEPDGLGAMEGSDFKDD